MTISIDETIRWCSALVGSSDDIPPLETCLQAIPSLDSLSDISAGSRVLVRGDTDVVVGSDGAIDNDVRLQSLVETLSYGI